MVLAHILCATTHKSLNQPPAAEALDWQQVSILKQVEVPLLQHAANSTSSYICSSAAGPADVLVALVEQLLPQASYTLDQVRHRVPGCCAPFIINGAQQWHTTCPQMSGHRQCCQQCAALP
jgi:hypothetical protein